MNVRESPLLLVVDDDPDQLFLMRRAAIKAGAVSVLTAASAWDAIGLLQARVTAGLPLPDLIITDLKMADFSGIDLVLALRRRSDLQRVPVCLLTSSSCPQDRQAAVRAGIDQLMQKPIQFDELVEFVRTQAARLRLNTSRLPPPAERAAPLSVA